LVLSCIYPLKIGKKTLETNFSTDKSLRNVYLSGFKCLWTLKKSSHTDFDWFDAAVLSFRLTQSLIGQADHLLYKDLPLPLQSYDQFGEFDEGQQFSS